MHRLLALSALVLALLVAGCGGSEEDGGSAASSSGAADAGAFPVTLQHKYGSTEITEAPKRVAVVGLREIDDLLALDIVPVLTTQFVGVDKGASGVRPWAEDELGDRKAPEAINAVDGIPVERVAASRPDLIIGRFSGMTKDEYEQLSQIAPTVAQPKDYPDYGEPWQEEMRAVGEAVGRSEEAERLVRETEARLADVREANPDFKGKTALVATPFQGTYVYGPEDPRGRLLSELGFEAPAGIEDVVGDAFGAQLSQERLDLVDVDALIWLVEGAAQEREVNANRVYSRLGVADRAIFAKASGVVYNGSSATTVLSIPAVLEELVPELQEAVRKAG